MGVEVKSMETRKPEQTTIPASKENKVADKKFDITDFIGEIKAELKRIEWTSPEDLKSYTKIVVGATFVCGMGIYFMDLIIQTGLWILESIMRFIA